MHSVDQSFEAFNRQLDEYEAEAIQQVSRHKQSFTLFIYLFFVKEKRTFELKSVVTLSWTSFVCANTKICV